jgi:hypothetical protein
MAMDILCTKKLMGVPVQLVLSIIDLWLLGLILFSTYAVFARI